MRPALLCFTPACRTLIDRALCFVLMACVGAPAAVQAQPRGDTLAVVVRIDDIQSRSTIAPRGLGPFEAVLEARGAKATWLVIPHRLAEPQNTTGALAGVLAAELRASALRGHEIALHGYTHICPRCGQTDHELYCWRDKVSHADSTQRRLLDGGLEILRSRLGSVPVTWVAPGHRADATTHRLLAERGLQVVSTHPADEPSLAASQRNLRTSNDYAWSLTDGSYAAMRTATLHDARTRGRAQGYYVLLLHDPFTRPGYGNGITLRWTGEVLDSLRREHRVRFLTMSETAAWLARPVGTGVADGAAPQPFSVSVAPTLARGPVTVRAAGLRGSDAVGAEVFDALGRRVARLGEATSGPSTTWTWDVAAPPGVYAVRVVTSDGRAATARVVVAR